jgi:uncharacterized protein (DUF983 family)
VRKGFLYSVAKDKCPRCNEGDLFVSKNRYSLKNIAAMPDCCAVCGQDFKVEDGFYLGATYVSYAITVAFAVPFLALAYFVFHLDLVWMLALMGIFLLALMPPIVRFSRSIWINFFIFYDEEWPEHAKKHLNVKE